MFFVFLIYACLAAQRLWALCPVCHVVHPAQFIYSYSLTVTLLYSLGLSAQTLEHTHSNIRWHSRSYSHLFSYSVPNSPWNWSSHWHSYIYSYLNSNSHSNLRSYLSLHALRPAVKLLPPFTIVFILAHTQGICKEIFSEGVKQALNRVERGGEVHSTA